MKIPTLPTIRHDLLGHYFFGSIFAVLGLLAAVKLGYPAWAGALAAAAFVGLLKDVVIDKMFGKGTFDPLDIVWTVAGGASVALGSALP